MDVEQAVLPAEPDSKSVAQMAASPVSLRGFTDQFVFPGYAKSDHFSERSQAEQTFDMVFVQGDPEQDIKPFYLSKTEVRLEMFDPWAMGYGMDWPNDEVVMRTGFYPSEYWGFYQSYEWLYNKQYPALAMSRTVAEKYCESLSELTGRTYRLPTEAEWEYALKIGGGVPSDRPSLLRVAQLDVAENLSEDVPFWPIPAKVGTKSADGLGLHDMLGNAAEWVSGTGKQRVVRGGHFELPPEKLSAGWRAVEDLQVWNETYPQLPVSRAFYRDFPYTGIRLACDADQAPITLPKDAQGQETPAP